MATPITAGMVKKLRDQTGAGMMECKGALTEANGDFEEAHTILRKRGLASAAKKTGRTTREGLIGHRVSADHASGILVEVNCESDFVARTPDFQQMVENILTEIEKAGATADEAWLQDPSGPAQKLVAAGIAKLGENMGDCALRAVFGPGLRRAVHPHGRQDRRAGRVRRRHAGGRRARGLRDVREGNRDADRGGQPVVRRPVRPSRPSCSKRSARSTAPRWSTLESRPTSSTRSSKASSAASTPRSCSSTRRPFVTPRSTVKDVIASAAKTFGVPVTVTRFARLKVGEGAQ